jgi:hypothetical protein
LRLQGQVHSQYDEQYNDTAWWDEQYNEQYNEQQYNEQQYNEHYNDWTVM